MNKLYIVVAITAISFCLAGCEKETITDEVNSINNQTATISEKIETEPIEAELIALKVLADEEFNYLRQFQTNLKSTMSTPVYVGVLPNSGSCPAGVPQIIWNEDLENSGCATKWLHLDVGCFKPSGLSLPGDAIWKVCIVDANTYNFDNIKYGYGVFALSFLQFFHGAADVSVFIDDNDQNNSSRFLNPTYGFTRNSASPYYPTQTLIGNTSFWLYYFKAESNTLKLPNLGFEYSIFSNFKCCDWTNQNVAYLDAEDDSPSNSIVKYVENEKGVTVNKLDDTYGVIQKDRNVYVYLQNAASYRY